jgi:hypothetical protein
MAQSLGLLPWIERVFTALTATNVNYPFLAYGTDWLAFAHLVIATAFIGPYVDPVRNKWVITFGLIACAGVIPFVLIAGSVRGIPFPWRLVESVAVTPSCDIGCCLTPHPLSQKTCSSCNAPDHGVKWERISIVFWKHCRIHHELPKD